VLLRGYDHLYLNRPASFQTNYQIVQQCRIRPNFCGKTGYKYNYIIGRMISTSSWSVKHIFKSVVDLYIPLKLILDQSL